MNNSVLIIDGYGFLFRAFFSVENFKTTSGIPVGAVNGFIHMLLSITSRIKTNHLLVVFDSGKKSFRDEIYPQYKANRPPCPDDLKPQFQIMREAVKSLNIDYCEEEGYEADDIIASYAQKSHTDGYEAIIATSDKDLTQLLSIPSVKVYDTINKKFHTEESIKQKFGVKPSQISDFLAIVGDASDNIPGIAGIGIKGCAELLSTFKTMEDIYQNIASVKPKLQNLLLKSKENAILSKKLSSLNFSAPTKNIDTFIKKNYNQKDVYDFLTKYELHTLKNKLVPNYKEEGVKTQGILI